MIGNRTINQSLILWAAIFVSLITYLGWFPIKQNFGFSIFYLGMAFFIFLLSLYIWKISDKHSVPEFILFCIASNNLVDELFYDPTVFEMNEVFFAIIIVIYSIKIRGNERRRT